MRDIILKILNALGIHDTPAWADAILVSLDVVVVLLLAFILHMFLRRLQRTVHNRLDGRVMDLEDRKRLDTINNIIGYVASVVIFVITALLVLGELGISITPLLTTAGIAGIAISFGAQSLVKDYFMGFVMLLENQIRQGDYVEAAGKSGTVEEVTLRYVRLRDGEGAVHYIPNGSITTVTNHSRIFAYALVEIEVSYNTDIPRVYEVIREVGQKMREDPQTGPNILADTEILGVNSLGDSGVLIRARLRTAAPAKWSIKRKFLENIKDAFDVYGIVIPFPQRVVHLPTTTDQPADPAQFDEEKPSAEDSQAPRQAG